MKPEDLLFDLKRLTKDKPVQTKIQNKYDEMEGDNALSGEQQEDRNLRRKADDSYC